MEKMEIIQKLKALSDRGVAGEKENATKLLKKLMKKYGITEEDLQEEEKKDVFITLRNDAEKRICYQILYAYFDDRPLYKCSSRSRTQYWVEMTAAQEIEFKYMLSVYLENFYKEQDIFIRAFIQKNKIFPAGAPIKYIDDMTPEEKAKSIKASLMVEGMEFTRIRKALDSQKGEDDEFLR